MHVTRHSHVIDRELLDRLWSLYERNYQRVADTSVTEEMLARTEFQEQLADDTNRIWVVWDETTPVAMAVIATDIARTRWLSARFFQTRYPEQFRSQRVHYVVWAVVDRAYAHKGAAIRLSKTALALEAQDGALLVFDVPEVNQPRDVGGAAELLVRLARMVSGAELVPLETQRYYAIDFAPTGPERAGEAHREGAEGTPVPASGATV